MPEDTLNVIEGVWLLDADGCPEQAKAPLNKWSTIRKDLKMQQIGPGNSFSENVAKATGRKVLLAVNARGGSALEEWMPILRPCRIVVLPPSIVLWRSP